MARPDPIEYAERLYGAIRAANFSPISFLAFGNAIKDGASMRNMPRIAAEPFMRVVGEMVNFEEDMEADQMIDTAATTISAGDEPSCPAVATSAVQDPVVDTGLATAPDSPTPAATVHAEKRRGKRSPNGG